MPKAKPAASNCHIVFTTGEPLPLYLEYKEPPAQLIEPTIRTTNPPTCTMLCEVDSTVATRSLKSRITPVKPTIKPVMVGRLLKFSFHLGKSSNTNQRGAAETNTATNELARFCSAHITAPLPMKSN